MVLCASAAISKASRMFFRSPGFNFIVKLRSKARYSRSMSFFSCSSLRLYLGICATVSIVNKFKQNWPLSLGELTYICSPFESLKKFQGFEFSRNQRLISETLEPCCRQADLLNF